MTKKEKFLNNVEKQFFESMGLPYPYSSPRPQWANKTDPTKKIIIGDIHEPYGHDKMLRDVLKHKDAETINIIGDIGDWYSKSRFVKKRRVSFTEELRAVFLRLQWLSIHFRVVNIILGNHDNRNEKLITKLFQGELDLMILTERDLLGRMASYFDNINMVGTKLISHTGEDMPISHIWQDGDVIYTHAEVSAKQSTAIMEKISNYLSLWRKHLKLKPYSVIVQAHNHRAMKLPRDGELWILNPCAMYSNSIGAEYIYDTRMIGIPPVIGYTILYQEKGITDKNKTNFYIYEE